MVENLFRVTLKRNLFLDLRFLSLQFLQKVGDSSLPLTEQFMVKNLFEVRPRRNLFFDCRLLEWHSSQKHFQGIKSLNEQFMAF